MSRIFLLLALLLSTFACKKTDCTDPVTEVTQIVFGVSYAECGGDCSRNYLLTQTQLFADQCDYCPLNAAIPFQNQPLGNNKFQIAQPLLDGIPAALFNSMETVYGCPGCADEGAYYLEITKDGSKHLFRWNDYFDQVPNDRRPYFEKVMQVLQDLQ